MELKRNSFVFYASFWDAIKELPKDIQTEVISSIVEYGLYGEIHVQLSTVSRALFTLIRPQLDANFTRYENGVKGAEYGKLGGRPPKNNNTNNPEITPKKPQENPKVTPNVNVNDNDNVNENENKYIYSFEEFWEDYEKKVGEKNKIAKKWEALKEEERLLIKEHVKSYKLSTPDKKFRKNPETYLNNKSWLDEIITESTSVKPNVKQWINPEPNEYNSRGIRLE